MIRISLCFSALLGLALTGAVAPTTAQTFESAYTDLDLNKCRHTPGKEEEDYGFWRCQGHAGVAVRVSAGDQRTYVSFGPRAKDQPAAGQTFSRFNSVDKTKIEWRIEKPKAGKAAPIATILRWHIKVDDDDKPSRGRVLVVTRLGNAVCHVGYVDGLANRDANALARKLADERAKTFDCAKDQRMIVGEQGESVAGMAADIAREAQEKKAQPKSGGTPRP